MTQTNDLSAETVADWIRDHPDLLCLHPELIDLLELPSSEDVASLIHHQLARLRKRNQQLEHNLQQLATIAGDNERLMQRLHRLTLELMSTESDQAFVDQLLLRLRQDFQADEACLHLVETSTELAGHPGVVSHQNEAPEWLTEAVERDTIQCGRLTRGKLATLFPNADEVASAALVPLAGAGLLAVGSRREDHFHPDVGTLFLDLLGHLVAWRLNPTEQDDRKRA